MKIFHLWIVFNSCVFMSFYFMTFLILKYSKLISALICAAAVTISVLLEIYRISIAFDAPLLKIFISIIQIPILQSCALILSKKKDSYALFIGFSSSNFVIAGNIASCGVLLITGDSMPAMAACTLCNLLVFLCMYYMIRDICLKLLSREISIWMCLVPAMCYITFYFMLYCPVSFEQRPEIMYSAGSLIVTIVVMYILLLHYVSAKSGEKELFWRNKELHAYIHGIELQTDAAKTAIQDIRLMRHDMRHKDYLLMELLHEHKYAQAEQMLHKDLEYLDRPYLVTYCENIVINSILCGMAKEAESKAVNLKIACALPPQQEINDYDLAILTANLTENAIQAAAKLNPKERQIFLTIKYKKGERFFLEIKNPWHEQVRFSNKTGLPISTQGGEHGLGMKSVQEFVLKYHAQFDCLAEQQMFIVRILIPFM
ncbi:MAG: sensor histidine kinase [Eubacterium sp.]|nr:sensor histidine kinase [Eubacterium sp.]MCI8919640.1 sensor histidine kinase [Eubacterium sp.]